MKKTNEIIEPNYYLKIANSRGRRPVLREIEKARAIISNLLIEINLCEGRGALQKCDSLLWSIICDNDNPINQKQ